MQLERVTTASELNTAVFFVLFCFVFLLCCLSDRHEVISKEILELDPWENQWNVVAINVLMHDSYDVCLVARMNPRDLIPPPSDLIEEDGDHRGQR